MNASDRSETAIVVLVLGAVAGILTAPVLGRLGAPMVAEAAMWGAAVCGVAAFGVAGAATLRAATRPPRTVGTTPAADERRASEETR